MPRYILIFGNQTATVDTEEPLNIESLPEVIRANGWQIRSEAVMAVREIGEPTVETYAGRSYPTV